MKKLFTSLFSFIMLVIVVLFSVITIARSMLNGNNLYDVIKESVGEKMSTKNINSTVIENVLPEEDSEKIIKYINENELSEEMGGLISAYIKYTTGVVKEKPDMDGFKEILEKAIKEYEKDTGKKVDTSRFDDAINSFEEVLEKNNEIEIDEKLTKIFGIIYSNYLYYGMIVVFILCLLFIYFINRKIIPVLRSSYIVFLISSIFFFIVSIISKYLNNLDKVEMSAFKKVSKLTRNCGIIELVIAIILIISVISIKKYTKYKRKMKRLKKKEEEEAKKEEIEKEEKGTEAEKKPRKKE